jgi:hypothetical protein
MDMDKKREEVYGVGIVFLVASILLSIFTGSQVINIGWNISTWVLVLIDCVCGVFGIGSLLKPDSFGVVVLRLMEALAKSQERSNSHNEQTQKRTSDSIQIMTHDDTRIDINQKSRGKEGSKNSKTFCCPEGHGNTVYPPDDNHPTASVEEDYARKYALGTVIPRKYTCEKEGCGSEFILYWYQERSGGYVISGKTPETKR